VDQSVNGRADSDTAFAVFFFTNNILSKVDLVVTEMITYRCATMPFSCEPPQSKRHLCHTTPKLSNRNVLLGSSVREIQNLKRTISQKCTHYSSLVLNLETATAIW